MEEQEASKQAQRLMVPNARQTVRHRWGAGAAFHVSPFHSKGTTAYTSTCARKRCAAARGRLTRRPRRQQHTRSRASLISPPPPTLHAKVIEQVLIVSHAPVASPPQKKKTRKLHLQQHHSSSFDRPVVAFAFYSRFVDRQPPFFHNRPVEVQKAAEGLLLQDEQSEENEPRRRQRRVRRRKNSSKIFRGCVRQRGPPLRLAPG